MIKRIVGTAAVVLGLLAVVLIANTLRLESRQIEVPPATLLDVSADAAAIRFGRIIAFATVSNLSRSDFDAAPFLDLQAYLAQAYPLMHAALRREVVNDYSLLYTWPGSDPGLKPVILMAHMDVVPIEPGTEEKWAYPPFSGRVADGFVWGRGAMDDKASFTAIFEAVEGLIARGFEPRRTIYLAFGHDEEVGGDQGAGRIAKLLAERGVRAEFTLDEGMTIRDGVLLPGFEKPVAVISTAEKGYVTLKLTARASGGHSARPPKLTAVGALSRAIAALEAHRFKPSLKGPTGAMFDYLAPEMDFGQRFLFANRWLFGGYLARQLTENRATNPMVRTTTAPTVFNAGIKDNVLPSVATAMVNFRVRPGETRKTVVEHARRMIKEPAVSIAFYDETITDPSPVAAVDGIGFRAIERAVREVYPEVLVAPGLTLGATDSRHYQAISDNVYRFVPIWFRAEDMPRVHGTNERMSVDNFAQIIRFYGQILRHAAGETP